MWEMQPDVKAALAPTFDDSDGLFWMEWADFISKFPRITICKCGVSVIPDKWAVSATQCAQCKLPIVGDDAFEIDHPDGSTSELHEACVELYEESLLRSSDAEEDIVCGACSKEIMDEYCIVDVNGSEVYMHSECASKHNTDAAPICLQCGKGVTSGAFSTIEENGVQQVLHQGCIEPHKKANAALCAHCGGHIVDGPYFTVERDGSTLKLHQKCGDAWQSK